MYDKEKSRSRSSEIKDKKLKDLNKSQISSTNSTKLPIKSQPKIRVSINSSENGFAYKKLGPKNDLESFRTTTTTSMKEQQTTINIYKNMQMRMDIKNTVNLNNSDANEKNQLNDSNKTKFCLPNFLFFRKNPVNNKSENLVANISTVSSQVVSPLKSPNFDPRITQTSVPFHQKRISTVKIESTNRTISAGFGTSPQNSSINQPAENTPRSLKTNSNGFNVPLDIKNYEAFWEAILDDDNIDKNTSKISQQKSMGDRNKTWLEKKNDKINQQKRLKKNKEMAECSFKPVFMTKTSQGQAKNSEKMYSKFLNRISETQNPVNIDINYINTISSRSSAGIFEGRESLKINGATNRTKEEELKIKKKIYNYILDSERDGINSIK